MSYSEKNFQTEFKNKNNISGVFELKITKGKSIAFNKLAEHQKMYLMNANCDIGTYWKISDIAVDFRKVSQKPFDCFYLKNTPAFVVVMFYEKRKKKNVYYIKISDWVKAEENHNKKSMKEEYVNSISYHYLTYNKVKK